MKMFKRVLTSLLSCALLMNSVSADLLTVVYSNEVDESSMVETVTEIPSSTEYIVVAADETSALEESPAETEETTQLENIPEVTEPAAESTAEAEPTEVPAAEEESPAEVSQPEDNTSVVEPSEEPSEQPEDVTDDVPEAAPSAEPEAADTPAPAADTAETEENAQETIVAAASEEEIETVSESAKNDSAASNEASPTPVPTNDKTEAFTAVLSLKYVDTIDGIDWSELVKPDVFNNSGKIIFTATFEDGTTANYETQYATKDANFYSTYEGDGKGGIEEAKVTVPRVIDGKKVKSYTVTADGLPEYYSCDTQTINFDDSTTYFIAVLTETLQTNEFKLNKEISPEKVEDETFKFTVTYTNGDKTVTKDYNVAADGSTTVTAPLGVSYQVTESDSSGYKLISYKVPQFIQDEDGTYKYETVTVTEKDSEGKDISVTKVVETTYTAADISEHPEYLKFTNSSTESEYPNYVTAVNQYVNYAYKCEVNWIDNESKTRPTATYTLQYSLDGEHWTPLTEETITYDDYGTSSVTWVTDPTAKEALGMTEDVKVEVPANSTEYIFTGLTPIDEDGNAVQYRVVQTGVPETGEGNLYFITDERDVTTNKTIGQQTITNTLKTTFTATIEWGDDKNIDSSRPDMDTYKNSLHLYRYKAGSTAYEEVTLNFAEGGNASLNREAISTDYGDVDYIWDLTVDNIPCYDANDAEYIYVLVQGTIGEDGTVNNTLYDSKNTSTGNPETYKLTYENGEGNFGNVTTMCYSGGTIHNVRYAETDIYAEKVWADSYSSVRPTTYVTLYRSSRENQWETHVVYNKEDGSSVVLDYVLASSGQTAEAAKDLCDGNTNTLVTSDGKNEKIVFNHSTISALPESFKLPKYDENGSLYTYSVSETMVDSKTADDYYATVTTAEDGHTVIKNTVRGKIRAQLVKTWVCPASLSDIDGLSVQLVLKAPIITGTDSEGNAITSSEYYEVPMLSEDVGNYDAITGDSKKAAETLGAFIPDKATLYTYAYYSEYDADGNLYDFSNAKIFETITDKSGNVIYDGSTEYFTINGNSYRGTTTYVKNNAISYGNSTIDSYTFTQTNRLSKQVDYTILKTWSGGSYSADYSKTADDTSWWYRDVYAVKFRLEGKTENPNASDNEGSETPKTVVSKEVIVYRDGHAEVTDAEGYKVTYSSWQSVQKVEAYDENGYLIDYRATEQGWAASADDVTNNNWKSASDHNPAWGISYSYEQYKTECNNHIGPGENIEIEFNKEWVDDGDVSSRKPVVFHVYQKVKDASGNEYYIDCSDQSAVDAANSITKETTVDDTTTTTKINNAVYIAPVTVTAGSAWYKRISFAVASGVTANDFIVKEYSLADSYSTDYGETAGEAKVVYDNVSDMTGEVSTQDGNGKSNDRQYKVENTNTVSSDRYLTATVKNIRIGTVNLKIVKTWVDGNNYGETRPQTLTFTVYRNGSVYKPDNAITGTNCTLGTDGTLVCTAPEGAGSEWTIELDGLDKYDSNGIQYTYTIVEQGELSSTDYGIESSTRIDTILSDLDYVSTQTSRSYTYTSEDGKDILEEKYSYTNKKSATTEVKVYKVWKDAAVAVSERNSVRPDVNYVLHQKSTNPNDVFDKEYYNYDVQWWLTGTEANNGFDLRVRIENLPKYDSDGYPYEYYFTEVMNNNGKNAFGQYVGSYHDGVTEETESGTTKPTYGSLNSEAKAYDGDFIVNTLTDYMTYRGIKSWKNVDSGMKNEDLPVPTITLHRYLASELTDDKTKEDVSTTVDTCVMSSDKFNYKFPNKEGGADCTDAWTTYYVWTQNDAGTYQWMLPKFSPSGERYVYWVSESFEDEYNVGKSSILKTIYSSQSESGNITNTFDKTLNNRSITVSKTWERTNVDGNNDKYPNVTFKLYRYVIDSTTTASYDPESGKFEFIASKTIPASNIAAGTTTSVTFDNLLIYSQKGELYGYYVVENSIDGYSVVYSYDGSVENVRVVNDGTTASGIYIENEPALAVSSGDYNETVNNVDSITVGAQNNYDKYGTITVSGQKKWDDYANSSSIYGGRPEDISVKLYRYNSGDSEQGQDIEKYEIALPEIILEDYNGVSYIRYTDNGVEKRTAADDYKEPYIVWSKTTEGSTDVWTYTIHNLERYAPNGHAYNYMVSEEQVAGYNSTPDSVSASASSNEVKLDAITNSFDTSYTVTKIWIDNFNQFGSRNGVEVTVLLQRAVATSVTTTDDGKTTYTYGDYSSIPVDSTYIDSGSTGVTYVTIGETTYLGCTLTQANQAGSETNKWTYTFTNLPSQDTNGNEYTYRCIEYAINGIAIADINGNYIVDDDGNYKQVGPYRLSSTEVYDSQTKISNDREKTYLTVSKSWEDNDDYYDFRPDTIVVKIQRAALESGSTPIESDWGDLEQADGTVLYETLSAANGWTVKVDNLPQCSTPTSENPTVYQYYYRAVELTGTDAMGKYIVTAVNSDGSVEKKNYAYYETTDYTAYNTTSTDKSGLSYSSGNFYMNLGNHLINPELEKIVVYKNWYNDDDSDDDGSGNESASDVEFKLQYKKDGDENWSDYRSETLEKGKTSLYWDNLPMYTSDDGKKISYQVVEVTPTGYKSVQYSYAESTDTETGNKIGYYTFHNLKLTSLTASKTWEGDQNNLYASRPDSIKVTLQQKVNDGSWTDVMNGENKVTLYLYKDGHDNGTITVPYTYNTNTSTDYGEETVTSATEEIEVAVTYSSSYGITLTGLPESDNGSNRYYYRIVENSTTVDGRQIVDSAKNYVDTTNYDGAWNYDATDGNSITLTNELIVKYTALTASKVWYNDSNTRMRQVYFDLKCSTDNGENWSTLKSKTLYTEDDPYEVSWSNLPKFTVDGTEILYKIEEQESELIFYSSRYAVVYDYGEDIANGDSSNIFTTYTRTEIVKNIELQQFSITKVWKNIDSYTQWLRKNLWHSYFTLQKKVGEDGTWETATTIDGTSEQFYIDVWNPYSTDTYTTWHWFPRYTSDGERIYYRAVETTINGISVTGTDSVTNSGGTNGSYIETYVAGDDGKSATTTNRLVYGFVNLKKTDAYLENSSITEETTTVEPSASPSASPSPEPTALSGVEFKLQIKNSNGTYSDYVTGIKTDENGNLINTNGKYGTEQKYLIAGTYKLTEVSTKADYSIWTEGVEFKVGVNGGDTDTGEHGTAWIYTTVDEYGQLKLNVEYLHDDTEDKLNDAGSAQTKSGEDAYNLESRGTISFTKTDSTKTDSDSSTAPVSHAKASDDSRAYFGVYTDSACTTQVAGMKWNGTDSDEFLMTLCNTAQDGTYLTAKNTAGVPYIRTDTDGKVYLLSGTYYIKELVAPAGYELDSTVRTAVVPKIDSNKGETSYSSNVGTVGTSDTDKSAAYQWKNTPNKVTIYKMDQYGNKITLDSGAYLELTVNTGTLFDESTSINLYQNSTTPSSANSSAITYDSTNGCWLLTGVFDTGKTYTITESAAPADYLKSVAFSFTVGTDGKITVTSSNAESKSDPLSTTGDDYNNYYAAGTDNNTVVIRDIARNYKGVKLTKLSTNGDSPIQHISFNLYKCDLSSDDYNNPVVSNEKQVNVVKNTEGKYVGKVLVTDANGTIELKTLGTDYINSITGKPLKYGLTPGTYYFEEVEAGASDKYQLLKSKIFFTITDKGDVVSPTNVILDKTEDNVGITFTGWTDADGNEDADYPKVYNEPVTTKELSLQKTNSKADENCNYTNLEGAHFTLVYTSMTDSQTGAESSTTQYLKSDSDGYLYQTDSTYAEFKTDSSGNKLKPDISLKGSYVLTEVKAPDYYMTRTGDASDNTDPQVVLTFDLDSNNEFVNITKASASDLIGDVTVTTSSDSTVQTGLSLSVKNELTKVQVKKVDETGADVTGAELSIYEAVNGAVPEGATAVAVLKDTDSTATNGTITKGTDGVWTLEGVLKEDTTYILRETTTPAGYVTASDVSFTLHGTTKVGNETDGYRYVSTVTMTPVNANTGKFENNTIVLTDVRTQFTLSKAVKIDGINSGENPTDNENAAAAAKVANKTYHFHITKMNGDAVDTSLSGTFYTTSCTSSTDSENNTVETPVTVTFTNGVADVELKGVSPITILKLPQGTYSCEEYFPNKSSSDTTVNKQAYDLEDYYLDALAESKSATVDTSKVDSGEVYDKDHPKPSATLTNVYKPWLSLTVQKDATGNMADNSNVFSFAYYLTLKDDRAYSGTYTFGGTESTVTASINSETGVNNISNSSLSLHDKDYSAATYNKADGLYFTKLKAGDVITFAENNVEALQADGYTISYLLNGEATDKTSITLAKPTDGTAITLICENKKDVTVPTEAGGNSTPYVLLFTAAAGFLILKLALKKKGAADGEE